MDKLTKALETIALGYSQGMVSIDVLKKACTDYKIKKGIVDNFDYEIIVAKSCFDFINNVPQDTEILKAIIPGQTKVVDGIMYVYSATKKGSKTEWGWHVVKQGAKTKKNIGRGSKITDTGVQGKQKYINDLFPHDLSSLTVVKRLGGSTGGQLVRDVDGNEYVMKKGSNTSKEHLQSEYITNQLYNALGLRTPDYELYEDSNGDSIMLSRFIPMAHQPNSSDYGKLAEGFIADILLANWDVYQNDNCLVDSSGRIFRVDNGGSLKYRAQGALKNPPFDGNVLATFRSMSKYNPGIVSQLQPQQILDQIKAIQDKRDDVVNFLIESGEDELAKIIGERFDNLKQISDEINKDIAFKKQRVQARLGKITPRTLKSADEMYGEFDSDTVQELWDNVRKNHSDDQSALISTGKLGWELLSSICQRRGFDARPRVVTEDEFWKLRDKTKHPIMFRGSHNEGSTTAAEFSDMFRFDDACFYGNYGIWGQGIYAHSDDTNTQQKKGASVDNKSTRNNYKTFDAYKEADGYAYGQAGGVVKLMWEPDANVVDSDDLLDEIKAYTPGTANSALLIQLRGELAKIKSDWTTKELEFQNLSQTIADAVKKRMQYNQDLVDDMYSTIDGIRWNDRNAQGQYSYPSYDDFVLGKLKNWVEGNGGEFEENNDPDNPEVKISFGSRSIYIAKYSWEHNAIKQKNAMSRAYHFQVARFLTFFDTNKTQVVDKEVQREINAPDGIIRKQLSEEISKLRTAYHDKQQEIDTETKVAAGKENLYDKLYKVLSRCNYRTSGNSDKSMLGIYAALRGYDGIYVRNGNGGIQGFTIILNRSKIITSID